MRKTRLLFLCFALISWGSGITAQDGHEGDWIASGLFLAVHAQYRIPDVPNSEGFDGGFATIVKTGDRLDMPELGNVPGFGASIGMMTCIEPRGMASSVALNWYFARGAGPSEIGDLSYADHEILCDFGIFIPLSHGFGAGIAHVANRRLLTELKACVRPFAENAMTGDGKWQSVGTELSRL